MTVGELLEKHKLATLGVLGAGVAALLAVVALFLFVRSGCGEDLDQSGEQFAQQAIETITTWDHEAVLDLMPPQARDQQQLVSYMKNSCSALRIRLGSRIEPVDIKGDAKGRFDLNQMAYATATFYSRCTFRHGHATISIDLYKNVKIAGPNGPWLLLNVRYSDIEE